MKKGTIFLTLLVSISIMLSVIMIAAIVDGNPNHLLKIIKKP